MLEQLEHVLSKQHAGRIRIHLLLLISQSDLEIFVKIGGLLELYHQKEILSIEMKRDVHESTDIIRVTSSLVFDSKPNKIIIIIMLLFLTFIAPISIISSVLGDNPVVSISTNT